MYNDRRAFTRLTSFYIAWADALRGYAPANLRGWRDLKESLYISIKIMLYSNNTEDVNAQLQRSYWHFIQIGRNTSAEAHKCCWSMPVPLLLHLNVCWELTIHLAWRADLSPAMFSLGIVQAPRPPELLTPYCVRCIVFQELTLVQHLKGGGRCRLYRRGTIFVRQL